MSCLEHLQEALGDKTVESMLAYNYFSGEPVTGLNDVRFRADRMHIYTGKTL